MTDEPTQHDRTGPGTTPDGGTSPERVPPESGAAGIITDRRTPDEVPMNEIGAHPEPVSGPRLWPRIVGVVILLAGVSGAWVWQNPGFVQTSLGSLFPGSTGHGAEAASLAALEVRVARLEQHPASADLGPLTQRLDAIEQRLAATGQSTGQPNGQTQAAADLQQVLARLDTLEARTAALVSRPDATPAAPTTPTAQVPTAASPATQDLRPVLTRLDALEKQQAGHSVDPARIEALAARIDTMAARDPAAEVRGKLDEVEHQLSELTASETKLAGTADHTVRLAQLEIALGAGRPLGTILGAPQALARFATTAPPTESGLRLAFTVASRAALKVSMPDTEGKPFLDRVLARLQDFRLITVRDGDRVVIGNSTAAALVHAQVLLNAGDLSGAARAVASLSEPAAEKMAPWLADATALIAAREALASLAENG